MMYIMYICMNNAPNAYMRALWENTHPHVVKSVVHAHVHVHVHLQCTYTVHSLPLPIGGMQKP